MSAPTVSQAEIDLYYWNYCIGLLDAANADPAREHVSESAIDALNLVAERRLQNMVSTYHKKPSYRVRILFDLSGKYFKLKRLP